MLWFLSSRFFVSTFNAGRCFWKGFALEDDTSKPGSCPALVAGFCLEECESDSDCDKDDKCCSNQCGHVCVAPGTSSIVVCTLDNIIKPIHFILCPCHLMVCARLRYFTDNTSLNVYVFGTVLFNKCCSAALIELRLCCAFLRAKSKQSWPLSGP